MFTKCPACGSVTTFQYVCPNCYTDMRPAVSLQLSPDAQRALDEQAKAVANRPIAVVTQLPPVRTDRRPAWDIVIEITASLRNANAYGKDGTLDTVLADMRERDQVGRTRYGVPLTSANGRDCLVDAYQEALDFAAYLAAELDEDYWKDVYATSNPPNTPELSWRRKLVEDMLRDHLRVIVRLRAIINEIKRETARSHPKE